MANQYQAVRNQRKGTGTMTIEPKTAPEPHNEILDLPNKRGTTTQGGIVPEVNAIPGGKAGSAITHPGEYASGSTGVSKT